MTKATWKNIAEQLDTADRARYEGRADAACEIYKSLISQQEVSDTRMLHFLHRRIALGCTALGEHADAEDNFQRALELSASEADRAKVYYDQARSFSLRCLPAEAEGSLRKAKNSYAKVAGPALTASVVIKDINDQLAGMGASLEPDWPLAKDQLVSEDTLTWTIQALTQLETA